MEKNKIFKAKENDYIMFITKANIAFSGRLVKLKELKDEEMIVLKPSENSPLWIVVKKDFIKEFKVLIPGGEK